MKTVVFKSDFAGKKEGEKFTCDSMLASSLVQRKLASYESTKKRTAKKKKEEE